MGLHGPQRRNSWIPNAVALTRTMRPTQTQPIIRCRAVPFGRANWNKPSANAAIAANACSWMIRSALSNGLSDIVCHPRYGRRVLPEMRPPEHQYENRDDAKKCRPAERKPNSIQPVITGRQCRPLAHGSEREIP